ncbi:MAG: type II toxin-antitoxin system RelE/ParE family toxin [Thermodesulfobacteriota bacterium]
MTEYRLVAEPCADLDVEAAFDWYEHEQKELGRQFLDELRAAYDRIADGPFAYRDLGKGIRRATLRRFPYAVYFAIGEDEVVVLAVLHAARDPAQWQRRRSSHRGPRS